MPDDKKKNNISEADEFWSTDMILPRARMKRKPTPPSAGGVFDTVEVVSSGSPERSGERICEPDDSTAESRLRRARELLSSMEKDYYDKKARVNVERDEAADLAARSVSTRRFDEDGFFDELDSFARPRASARRRSVADNADPARGRGESDIFGGERASIEDTARVNARTDDFDTSTVDVGTTAPDGRGNVTVPPRRTLESNTEHITLGAMPLGSHGSSYRAPVIPAGEELCESYEPTDNPLICGVEILMWPSRYTFYGRFRKDAERYFGASGKSCERVPYFSFTPQYDQLSSHQLDWYLFWRGMVRRGEYPDTDFSYILLYIYEIINLPDKLLPRDGVRELCRIWAAYRQKHPKLDRYLCEWVCDYCLLHKVSLPLDIVSDFLDTLMRQSTLKEFYAGCSADSASFAGAFYSIGLTFNWRNSKYVTDENRAFFEKHMKRAFVHAFSKLEDERDTPPSRIVSHGLELAETVTVRDAYNGALCAYDVKRRIRVRYLSCTRSIELRYAANDTEKYIENNIRALLSIKSRYRISNMDVYLKRAVDEYFEPFKRRAKQEKKRKLQPVPEYEKRYERISEELSSEAAARIDETAWDTARLLTDAFDEVPTDEMSALDRGRIGSHGDVPRDTAHGDARLARESARGGDAVAGAYDEARCEATERTDSSADNSTGEAADKAADKSEAIDEACSGVRGSDVLTGTSSEASAATDAVYSSFDAMPSERLCAHDSARAASHASGGASDTSITYPDAVTVGESNASPAVVGASSAESTDSSADAPRAMTAKSSLSAGAPSAFDVPPNAANASSNASNLPHGGSSVILDDSELAAAGIAAVLSGDSARIAELAEQRSLLPETFAELLNEFCYDIIGDIAVEYDEENGIYSVIPDYKEELEEWLNR